MRRHRLNAIQRTAAKVLIAATLTATLIGAPFRCCRAEEGREHSPPETTPSAPFDSIAAFSPNVAPRSILFVSPARVASSSHAAHSALLPRSYALVHCTVTHSFWRAHEHYEFTSNDSFAADRREKQRRLVAIHLGRSISRRGDADTATRIETIYSSLQIAHWGRHSDGELGGHFNFDYSDVRSIDLDRMLPHARYGSFASLHFHHAEERVHVDAANPFGLAGVLVPVHFFVDVVAGHLPWHGIIRLCMPRTTNRGTIAEYSVALAK